MGLRLRSKTDDVVIQLRWLVERDLSPTFYLKIHVVSVKPENMKKIRENTNEFKNDKFWKKIYFFNILSLQSINVRDYTTIAFII